MDYAALRRAHLAAVKDRDERKLTDEVAGWFKAGHVKPTDFSVRRLFEALVEDGTELVRTWQPGAGGQPVLLSEADAHSPAHLLEAGATVSSAFSNITGQIVYNAVMEKYEDEDFVFTPLVTTVPTQFNGERIAGVTRLGDTFESIQENQPYPIAGVGEDYIDTPQTVKRGEIVPLSREAIFYDRTNLLLERAGEAGTFYGYNKEARIIDAMIDENVTAHRYKWKGTIYATFQASTPWINVKTSNALVNWTNVDAAELILSQIVDPHTGLPILITPKHLIVTRQLRNTAKQIITATEVRKGDGASNTAVTIGVSPLDSPYQVKSSALLAQRMGTDTDWFIGDVSKAVKYMQNWPMEVTMAPPNSHAEFTQDIVKQWKVSERGAAAVVEPRALIKSSA